MGALRSADSMEAVLVRASLAAMAFALIGGAAAAQAPEAAPVAPAPTTAGVADPWERTNRKLYGIHQSIDRKALRPAAMGYKAAVPNQMRKGLRNAIHNVSEPVVIFNYVLQARFGRAVRSFTRFTGNSVFGLGGFIDLAGKTGLPRDDTDFGATLARYGVKPGPYVFVPLVGPSTKRDLFGKGVDIALDPFAWIAFPGRFVMNTSRIVVGGLDTRVEVDGTLQQIDSMATDSYATLRSLYLQNRQSELGGGVIDLNALPDFDDPGAPLDPASGPAQDSAPQPPPEPSDAPAPAN